MINKIPFSPKFNHIFLLWQQLSLFRRETRLRIYNLKITEFSISDTFNFFFTGFRKIRLRSHRNSYFSWKRPVCTGKKKFSSLNIESVEYLTS